MSDPTFTGPPIAPQPSDSPDAFNTKAFSFFGWFAAFTNEMGIAVPWLGARAAEAQAAATAADASKVAAGTSETNASASATAANTSKTNAATSATNAGNSATAAASSATAADGSKTAAATSATNALNSATAANLSKVAAGTSETNAAASATAANNSKVAAGTSETNAAASAAAALASKNAAGASETSAAASAATAGTSATAAVSAKTAAEQAAADAAASAEQAAGGGEPTILPGTAAQYFRGDKTWRDFATDVRAVALAGLSTASGAVVAATDSVLVDIGKLQKQVSDIAASLGNKVDAVAGKGLSTQDYTTAEQTKLAGIAASANNYTHPTGDGNQHVPATGTVNNGKVLKAGATAGSAAWAALTSADVGLNLVNNTSDANKPVSTAQQVLFNTKAPLTTPTIIGLREAVIAMPASNIDLAAGNRFSKTIAANTTFTLSNPPAANTCQVIVLRLTVSAGVPTFWAGVVWDKGTPPTLTAGKTCEIAFLVGPNGTSTTAALIAGDSR